MCVRKCCYLLFFYSYGAHRDLHVLTHSFPTRRSSDLAFESLVKLVACLAVGLFVTFGVNDGFGELFDRAAAQESIARLFVIDSGGSYLSWVTLTLLSMAAIICLPRQFPVTVVEKIGRASCRERVCQYVSI